MIFKEKDKVFDAQFGWGEVVGILQGFETRYPIMVEFVSGNENYDRNGAFTIDGIPTLSFTEYTLEGFSQERPKEPLPFKVGDVVYLNDKDMGDWTCTRLRKIAKDSTDYSFRSGDYIGYSLLALENPLKNPYTKIYTREDL